MFFGIVRVQLEEADAKLSLEDKQLVRLKCEETNKCLDSNNLADKDEIEYKQNELTKLAVQ